MVEFIRKLFQFLLVANWRIFLPVVLGGVALYLLLPRARGYRPLWGALAGGLAILSAGWLLTRAEVAPVAMILFYAFSGIAIVSGSLLVTQRNPVYAALSFALVVLSTCGLFLLQAAPFLMAATIIVYAGAIVVTFLFVIMLAQQAGLSNADQRSREPLLSTIAGFVLLGALLYVLVSTYDSQELKSLDSWVKQTGDFQSQADARAAGRPAAGSSEEVLASLDKFLAEFHRWVDSDLLTSSKATDELVKALEDTADVVQKEKGNAQPNWESAKKCLDHLHDVCTELQMALVSAPPSGKTRLSGFSGPPANLPFDDPLVRRNEQGQPGLPAENVATLGMSLFTDYLLPVELAGTLLLAATIGAIAIAARRTEGLR